jgi:predicted nucleotidyltransferase
MKLQVQIDRAAIAQFCNRWGIVELSLFGSAIRQDFSPESDVDVLVKFAPESHPTLFDMVRMQSELSQFFGRSVDLVSRRGIENSRNYLRRKEILNSAYPIYAAAA